ncbi:MAG: amidase [Acidimicrobiia bacterium]|nr:amidase [Acidimicrobiia bacterium]
MDATAQAALVRSGQVSPVELVDAAIDRIERIDPQLNAVIHRRFERAREEAAGDLPDGPFRGVPMLLKDLDGFQAGEPYHGGVAALADAGFLAPTDSWLTERFRRMGVVFVGRTNVPELGLLPSTEPAVAGPSRNPWDLERSPAGSSGGSAAAVAAGLVPLAHAGDGGGSIRLPASVCGLVGLKPSRGRITLGPEAGEAWGGLVARLVVTRSVRDTAGVLDAVHGPGTGDPYWASPPSRPYVDELDDPPEQLRVRWTTTSPDAAVATEPEVRAAVQQAVDALGSLGHHVDEGTPAPWTDAEASASFTAHFVTAMGVWTAAELESLSALSGVTIDASGVEPGTWTLAEMGRGTPGAAYYAAVGGLHAAARALLEWWEDESVDVLVTPTIPEVPWTLGQFGAQPDNPVAGLLRAAAIVPFTAPFNVSGQPAISLPLGQSPTGLPIGVQLVARPGREDLLVGLAAQLEQAAPWQERRPAVHA